MIVIRRIHISDGRIGKEENELSAFHHYPTNASMAVIYGHFSMIKSQKLRLGCWGGFCGFEARVVTRWTA